jgi:hypothetical protein
MSAFYFTSLKDLASRHDHSDLKFGAKKYGMALQSHRISIEITFPDVKKNLKKSR